ncbi:MAG: DEAD/DEAH box helicase, partial [Planctomycetaceae bacterium]
MYEALHTGSTAYYTSPLIALTEQKFREMQAAAERWGFSADDVGLVTGNRRVNPEARVLVVVAEILLNRLLNPEEFTFDHVSAVVMDEFHNFSDPQRGVVWELSLALLPKRVRLLLLSATVGNSVEFVQWLRHFHGKRLQLIQNNERKVPLYFEWVGDQLLNDQLLAMSDGNDDSRRVPALVFCFNRSECWSVAEQLKGKKLIQADDQQRLAKAIAEYDMRTGAGPKLKQLLLRGVGIHHAGLLPKFRRIVEELFQRKWLSVVVCTETLAAGINLPARSVVMTSLVKGPPMKKKLIPAGSAQQMFGRAGRPQFDDRGFIYAMAHEDDVRLLRWKQQYDQIPEDTKDPALRSAKKRLKKKMPSRRSNQQYWNEKQFVQLQSAAPASLVSRGPLPWRLLAYMLTLSPDVGRLRTFARQRLLNERELEQGESQLKHMLRILGAGGFVRLDPPPPQESEDVPGTDPQDAPQPETPTTAEQGTFGQLIAAARSGHDKQSPTDASKNRTSLSPATNAPLREAYEPRQAHPTERLQQLLTFRSINPIYGVFLLQHLGLADRCERLQLLESVLGISGSLLRQVRVPPPDVLPPGPLTLERIDPLILRRGLATSEELQGNDDPYDRDFRAPLPLADKIRRLFDSEFPGIDGLRTAPIWIGGDLLEFDGDFEKLVRGRDLVKQEGLIFRHVLS